LSENTPNTAAQSESMTPPPPTPMLQDITAPLIESVSELMDCRESFGDEKEWAYRGQPREFGTLIPSFQRQFSRQSAGAAELIERRLIEAFRSHYSGLPDRSTDMPTPEKIDDGHPLRCLSVMQHYEIPTRLLDWTSDFWTAIYFACASDPSSNAELWLYDRSIFRRQRDENPHYKTFVDRSDHPPPEPQFLGYRQFGTIVELDPQISPRMKKQAAHHTVASYPFADHAPLIYELRKKHEPLGEFIRLPISGSCKGKALQFLAEEKNITASTIFPDVVGLGRFLRWQFESLRTTLM
jgi:hypothetical protein